MMPADFDAVTAAEAAVALLLPKPVGDLALWFLWDMETIAMALFEMIEQGETLSSLGIDEDIQAQLRQSAATYLRWAGQEYPEDLREDEELQMLAHVYEEKANLR